MLKSLRSIMFVCIVALQTIVALILAQAATFCLSSFVVIYFYFINWLLCPESDQEEEPDNYWQPYYYHQYDRSEWDQGHTDPPKTTSSPYDEPEWSTFQNYGTYEVAYQRKYSTHE